MRTYIVTGATGFLGKAFVQLLLMENERVTVIVRDKYKAMDLWGGKVEIIKEDLADINSKTNRNLRFSVNDENILVHFAWEGASGDERALEITQLDNVKISCALMRKAREWGCQRFIYAGSIMEYEAMKTVASDSERPFRNMMYSIAKLTADFMLKTIAADIGVDYLNVIISNIFGPGEVSRRFLNNVVRSLIKNDALKLTEGFQPYDFIYSDDAMKMIKAVADRGNPFESYYIGNSTQRPLRDFVMEARKVLDSSSELLFGAVPLTGQPIDYKEFDCTKMETLGVIPEVSFSEGIKRTAGWILAEKGK